MKPALLVIDAQNEYFAPHGQWVLPEGERALERINALIAVARETDTPVFHILHERLGASSGVFTPGSAGARMYPGLDAAPDEPRILKHFPGSFTQTPLAEHLRQAGADTLVIAGYMTHLCCDTTARQAKERAYDVLFATDATATRDLKLNGETVPYRTIHESTLAVMGSFAETLDSEAIARRLRERKA
ncbi:MAG TPA: cysteine hydrolase family protein [Ktedonobacterales bacterium]|nr:cysteine hydrolase family protein [Ktedonobacterales bacterium]